MSVEFGFSFFRHVGQCTVMQRFNCGFPCSYEAALHSLSGKWGISGEEKKRKCKALKVTFLYFTDLSSRNYIFPWVSVGFVVIKDLCETHCFHDCLPFFTGQRTFGSDHLSIIDVSSKALCFQTYTLTSIFSAPGTNFLDLMKNTKCWLVEPSSMCSDLIFSVWAYWITRKV